MYPTSNRMLCWSGLAICVCLNFHNFHPKMDETCGGLALYVFPRSSTGLFLFYFFISSTTSPLTILLPLVLLPLLLLLPLVWLRLLHLLLLLHLQLLLLLRCQEFHSYQATSEDQMSLHHHC